MPRVLPTAIMRLHKQPLATIQAGTRGKGVKVTVVYNSCKFLKLFCSCMCAELLVSIQIAACTDACKYTYMHTYAYA